MSRLHSMGISPPRPSARPRSTAPLYSARPTMTPASPGTAASCRISSSEPTPPDAKTGIPAARATAAVLSEVRARFHAVARDVRVDDRRRAGPGRVPGQRQRVEVEDARPAVDGHAPVGGVDTDDDAVLESTAHLAEKCRIEGGARADDRPSARPPPARASTCEISRRPPPTWTGMASARMIWPTTAVWAGRPSKAPSRSTTCRRVSARPPASSGPSPPGHRRRRSPVSARPWRSRTHRPSLTSTAGTISKHDHRARSLTNAAKFSSSRRPHRWLFSG